jgi:hypothetical protein
VEESECWACEVAVGGKTNGDEAVCQLLWWWVRSMGERGTETKGCCAPRVRRGLYKIGVGGGPCFVCLSI